MLGIDEGILPADLAAGRALQDLIFRRQHAPSAVGAELTATLLGLARSRMPRWLAGLAPALLRRYVGDDVADLIDVPRAGSARFILAVLVAFTRLTTLGRGSPTRSRPGSASASVAGCSTACSPPTARGLECRSRSRTTSAGSGDAWLSGGGAGRPCGTRPCCIASSCGPVNGGSSRLGSC